MAKIKQKSRIAKLRNKTAYLKKKRDEPEGASSVDQVFPLIEKLQSTTDLRERSMAVNTVSILCNDTALRKSFLKEKLVKLLLEESLKGADNQLLSQVFILLKILIEEEGYDIGVYVWRLNIWKVILKAYEAAHTEIKSNVQSQDNLSTEAAQLMEISLDLVLSLLDADNGDNSFSEKVFAHIVEDNLTQHVTDLLNLDHAPANVYRAGLGYLFNLCNYSAEFVKTLKKDNGFQLAILEHKATDELSKMYLEGLKFHFFEIEKNQNIDQFLANAFENILHIITPIDVQRQLTALGSLGSGTYLSEARMQLLSIDVGLDLLATLVEYNGTQAELDEYDRIEVNSELLEFYEDNLAKTVLQLWKFSIFQHRVSRVLNNLFWLMFTNKTPLDEVWYQSQANFLKEELMPKLFHVVEYGNFDDFELFVEDKLDYLSLTWVLLKSLKTVGYFSLDDLISLFTLAKLASLYEFSMKLIINNYKQDSEFLLSPYTIQQFFTSLVGINTELALNISSSDSYIEVIDMINQFHIQLLGTCLTVLNPKLRFESKVITEQSNYSAKKVKDNFGTSLETICIETINSFFDIFGDASFGYDQPVFVLKDVGSQLQDFLKSYRTVYKSIDKNKFSSLKIQSEETLTNLERFIQYKKSESG
ncbi:BA75_02440T0 [Komagataella pastoris]|uniref:BA75_02440T0 n=1 Tax=Komagataella pastoris TaxID=4922 RepID=A0A1B2JDC6_PICPA|nr:BA75_02440T0 [Komagataella pastoris]